MVSAGSSKVTEPDVERLAGGYQFCEAVRADEEGVSFSDLVGGGYYRVRSDGTTETILADRIWIGGAVRDEGDAWLVSGKGGLVLVEHGVTRPVLDQVGGQKIIAINDIEGDGRGGIFGGTIDFEAVFDRGETPAPTGRFFHLAADGALTILREDVVVSNGIGFSPDGRTLYHSESTVGIWAWPLVDGRPSGAPALLAEVDDCDGLAVDVEGGIWVAFYREAVLRRFRTDGSVDRTIPLPAPSVVSLAFGGADHRELFVATGADAAHPEAGGILRFRTDVAGMPVHRSAFAGRG